MLEQDLLEQLEKDGIFAKAYKIGFVVHPEREWLGASPDRLLNIGGQWALAEIKNWYQTAEASVRTCVPR